MYLDHIVHFINQEPEGVIHDWNKRNFNAVIGGSHEQWGTYNALLYTKDSYVEFLAVEDPEKVEKSDHPLIMHLKHDLPDRSGFGTICIRTFDIEELKNELDQKGIRTTAVFHAQRRTMSGSIRKWKMLFVDEKVGASLPFPFFIEWEEPDVERFASLRNDGTIQEGNQRLSIHSCIFHVGEPQTAASRWGEVLGISPSGAKGNELQLSNSKLIFELAEGKERLAKVHIKGHGTKLDKEYAGGVYSID